MRIPPGMHILWYYVLPWADGLMIIDHKANMSVDTNGNRKPGYEG
ncbi:MAG: hypothetical protein ABW007_24680 [Chitinophagaceae bacterium]